MQYDIKALRAKYRMKGRGQAGPVIQQIASMYNNARSPSVTRDMILRAFAELESLKPSKAELAELGSKVDSTAMGSVADMIKRAKQSVLNRKGDAERTRQ